MQIQVNGEPFDAGKCATLGELVNQLGLAGKRIAIELNMEIVPRSEHESTPLKEGDSVEVVHAIGGG
ncbi:Sulfur carrier protein ThiS [Marinobacterium lacunae]|uniref:Sulfur carrier protein ThiS n=1 Tax=Marinobacterium lacunae TaxID=1232683 RepID=A0A081FYH0_9GAMM|nr:sulfur carrier protein ThiS [Marinobacterium lacunae]KEA63575.1 Sulfur carrier protein ThiS [Marinobacterium lacunae]MBR9884592.1 sulfur carrier protein ThiS [Oceanospirillales bacterium]